MESSLRRNPFIGSAGGGFVHNIGKGKIVMSSQYFLKEEYKNKI